MSSASGDASFDSNILIDSLAGHGPARDEIRRVARRFISRVTWIEVMVGITPETAAGTERFLDRFILDEVEEPIARRAASLRAANKKLKLPDAIIWASAQIGGRTLITRNTKDFRAGSLGVHIPYQF